ncbi:hypothetical protein [Methylobacterium gnaphalii]|nr:hypothetical protein [Methylobacterium gnaphalii]
MRSILASTFTVAACLALTTAAFAKPVRIAPGNPPITADIPSAWKVSEIDRGIQARTGDDEVYVWFESYMPAQFETLLAEHNAYFKKQGVAITGEAKTQSVEFATYDLKSSDYPATYEKGPTVIRYLSIVPKEEGRRHLLISYWASPAGDKRYDADVNKILESLRASVEAR